ncbi:TadE/TadG family type IV pilus assembly protein [Novosphingobium sp. 9U]|uniref:TadE/TadG family type IV pilus assembly protein n=1 Tax=Novosphingobium sp. 9U TaxID=2653158 RepID=UPI00135AB286|nr:TadE/TadG family type IV pilus assembly protein [Novosphingobium sp. 9U]
MGGLFRRKREGGMSLRARLLRDRRGSTLPIMGAAFVLVLGGVGSAVDIGRIYVVRSQMQAGVDAAALAGARSFEAKGTGPEGRDAQVLAYFRENFAVDFLGAGTVTPVPTFSVVKGVNVTKVDASVDLPLTFMSMFGVGPQPVVVSATAELQPRPLEIMVVLDDTGSMKTTLDSGKTRMAVLKEAMHGFVNVLYQGSTTRDELALGMITYTVTTNVGGILQEAGVKIKTVDGYTNLNSYLNGKSGIGEEGLAWKGCVEDDPTVRDLSASPTTFEAGAADILRDIPADGVRPYLFPPSAETKNRSTNKSDAAYDTGATVAADYQPSNLQSETGDSRRNNMYRLTTDPEIAQTLANTEAWKQHFFDFYRGLNEPSSSKDDDVLVHTQSGNYFNPQGNADYTVMYSRIPYINDATAWANANAKYAYPLPTGTTNNLKMPSPNWQCPNPGIGVKYGRGKSVYDNFIDNDNYALMPASGTLHHIGFLWGYRLLARDDLFKRTNPIPDQEPIRAIVFMTDGQTEAGDHATWYGAYGRMAEKRITASGDRTIPGNRTTFRNQVMYRFGKVCQKAKTERNPIKVYIVSLLDPEDVTENVFTACAGSNYLETTTTTQIIDAFRNIAVDLVQLHLTQ